MTHPSLTNLRQYWEELRAGRLVPLRSEIDPREISSSLATGFIVEQQEPGLVRFRLAGMEISDAMGMEVRGMPLRALIVPTARARFTETLDQLFRAPEIQEFRLRGLHPSHPPLDAVMLVLPLRSDDGKIDRAIGCIHIDGAPKDPPRRFDLLQVTRTGLGDGVMKSELVREQNAMGMAEAAQKFEGLAEIDKPHLTLVKDR